MKSIDVMRSRPGVYVVIGRAPGQREHCIVVEVDSAGVVHQLKLRDPAMPRDGVCTEGRWLVDQIVRIEGPLSRESLKHTVIPWSKPGDS